MGSKLCMLFLVLIAGMVFCGCSESARKLQEKREGERVMVEKPWAVSDVAFSPDGRLLAAGRGYHDASEGGGGEVTVWQVENWNQKSGFAASFSDQAQAIGFTADGTTLIAATNKYVPSRGPNPWRGDLVYVWAVRDGELTKTIHLKPDSEPPVRDAMSMAVSPDGELIVLVCLGSAPVVLRRKTGERAYELEGPTGLAFSPNGKSLVSVVYLKPLVRLYDAANGNHLASIELKCNNPAHVVWGQDGYEPVGDTLTCVRFSPDGKQIAVGVSDGSVRLLTADLTKQLRSLEVSDAKDRVVSLAYAAKADLLAAATCNGVALFDAHSGKRLQVWGKADMGVSAVALSPDGKLLAAGYAGEPDESRWPRKGFINIWDTKTGRLVKKLD